MTPTALVSTQTQGGYTPLQIAGALTVAMVLVALITAYLANRVA